MGMDIPDGRFDYEHVNKTEENIVGAVLDAREDMRDRIEAVRKEVVLLRVAVEAITKSLVQLGYPK